MCRIAFGAWSTVTIKRQIINFNQRSIDVRIGSEIMDELSRLAAAPVGKPKRALMVADGAALEARGEDVRRSLVSAGFTVEVLEPAIEGGEDGGIPLEATTALLEAFARCGLTADDLVFALGSFGLCSLAAFCAHVWRGGVACTVMPFELEGMVRIATEMEPLGVAGAPGSVALPPNPAMVLCDFALVPSMTPEQLHLGCALMACAALAEGKKTWTDLREHAASVAVGEEAALRDALAATQVARRNVLKSPNPSARRALEFGDTAARALAACVAGDVPRSVLRAEGMRFEARLAVDAAGLKPEVAFDLDDLLFDLGIEDAGFTLDADAFVAAIRAVVAERSNRFLLPLPKAVGQIRLTSVADELLERHAAAYAASLAPDVVP